VFSLLCSPLLPFYLFYFILHGIRALWLTLHDLGFFFAAAHSFRPFIKHVSPNTWFCLKTKLYLYHSQHPNSIHTETLPVSNLSQFSSPPKIFSLSLKKKKCISLVLCRRHRGPRHHHEISGILYPTNTPSPLTAQAGYLPVSTNDSLHESPPSTSDAPLFPVQVSLLRPPFRRLL